MVEFFCPGIGRPKGSKRLVRTRRGRTLLLEDSKRERPWSSSVTAAAAEVMRGRDRFACAPLAALMVFGFARPKSHYTRKGLRPDAPRWHTSKPDASKLARSVEDALNGVVWDDDSRVAQLAVCKPYVELDELPGVAVAVVPAGGDGWRVDEDALSFYRRVAGLARRGRR